MSKNAMEKMKLDLEVASKAARGGPRDQLLTDIEAVCASMRAFQEVSTGTETSAHDIKNNLKFMDRLAAKLTAEKSADETADIDAALLADETPDSQ